MNHTLYATFPTLGHAQQALGALMDHGLTTEHVSVVAREGTSFEDARKAESMAEHGLTVTTPQDAGMGAAQGAGVGLTVGAAAALVSILVPGIGLVAGGGALATALVGLAGSTAAGAVAGGAMGYLKDQGLPEGTLSSYEDTVNRGGAIVGVSIPTMGVTAEHARKLLEKYGATDVTTYSTSETMTPST